MPVQLSTDVKGRFARWGTSGKKYYFSTTATKTRAMNKARAQGIAIKIKQLKK